MSNNNWLQTYQGMSTKKHSPVKSRKNWYFIASTTMTFNICIRCSSYSSRLFITYVWSKQNWYASFIESNLSKYGQWNNCIVLNLQNTKSLYVTQCDDDKHFCLIASILWYIIIFKIHRYTFSTALSEVQRCSQIVTFQFCFKYKLLFFMRSNKFLTSRTTQSI